MFEVGAEDGAMDGRAEGVVDGEDDGESEYIQGDVLFQSTSASVPLPHSSVSSSVVGAALMAPLISSADCEVRYSGLQVCYFPEPSQELLMLANKNWM